MSLKTSLLASMVLLTSQTAGIGLNLAQDDKPVIEKSETNFNNPNACCPCPGVLKVISSTDHSLSQIGSKWRQNTVEFENNCCKCTPEAGFAGSENYESEVKMQKGATHEQEYDEGSWKAEGFMFANKSQPAGPVPLKAKTDEWWMTEGHNNIISKKDMAESKQPKTEQKKEEAEKKK